MRSEILVPLCSIFATTRFRSGGSASRLLIAALSSAEYVAQVHPNAAADATKARPKTDRGFEFLYR
jgi:hypothetical protein